MSDVPDYDSAIIDFLARKENLPHALEISDRIERVKDRLVQKFWQMLQERVTSLLTEDGLDETWKPTLDDNILGHPRKTSVGLSLLPSSMHGISPHFNLTYPRIELEGGRLYYGLVWREKVGSELRIATLDKDSLVHQHAGVRKLVNAMEKEGFKVESGYWSAWKWTAWDLRAREALLRLAEEPEEFADEVADVLRRLCKETSDLIIAANRELSGD